MGDHATNVDRLLDLAGAVCNKSASEYELAELYSILAADQTLRYSYADYCRIHAALRLELRAHHVTQKVDRQIASELNASAGGKPTVEVKTWNSAVPPRFPFTALHAPLTYLSSGWPVAYLIATVIFGIGALIGALMHVSQPGAVADRFANVDSHRWPAVQTQAKSVGRITGMLDLRWADTSTVITSNRVALGQKFAMASGLMEITYDTGAKIILQSPVTYVVESTNGGFLSIGKLTGKVEVEGAKGFLVRTPAATIVDIGTEFGVKVDKRGSTTAHVYRGSVKLKALDSESGNQGGAVVLHENDSYRVEQIDGVGARNYAARRVHVDPETFVRSVVQPPKTLDLLDIVAGGNGTGHQREHGIDAVTGMQDSSFDPTGRETDGTYKRVGWHALIDGVFIPGGGEGPVVVDSAGHTFDGFQHTWRYTRASIWARAASFRADDRQKDHAYWVYAMGPGNEYMPKGQGMLCLAGRMGITFDLEAARTMYPQVRPGRFLATVAVADARRAVVPVEILQAADVWIFVDGQLKFQRSNFQPEDGVVNVDIALGPKDRFLTLVTTVPTAGVPNFDWLVYGDPVLEMVPREDLDTASKK